MARDVTSFLSWAAEPHLEARHKIGFKAITYLILITDPPIHGISTTLV